MKAKKATRQRWKFCKLYEGKSHARAPFRVMFYQGGKRIEKAFTIRSEAIAFGDSKNNELINHGSGSEALSPDERGAITLWRESGPSRAGTKLTDLVRSGLERLDAASASVSLGVAIEVLLEKRKGEKKAPRTINDLEWRLSKLREYIGADVSISHLTSTHIEAWLAEMVAAKQAPQSVLNYRRVALSLFNEAVWRGWVPSNPVKSATRPKVPHTDVTIYTGEETVKLLAHCTNQILPMVAIGLFAGLRTAELIALKWEQVEVERGHIRLTITKTSQPRIVPISDNLKKWLIPYAQSVGPLWVKGDRLFATRLQQARKAAGVTGDKDNAMRHSFGSYRTAVTQNIAQVALEMGNTPKMVQDHYRELVTEKQGKEFFSIMPDGKLRPPDPPTRKTRSRRGAINGG